VLHNLERRHQGGKRRKRLWIGEIYGEKAGQAEVPAPILMVMTLMLM